MICNKCQKDQIESNFYKGRHICRSCCNKQRRNKYPKIKEKLSLAAKKYYLNNKEKVSARVKSRYLIKRDEILEKGKAYAKIPENYAKHRISGKVWREKKRLTDPIYFKNWRDSLKEWKIEYTKKYRRENREWYLAQKQKRRVLEKDGLLSENDIKNLFNKQSGKCFYCGAELTNKYTIEHLEPLCRGGKNNKENSVLACKFCNSSKNKKTLNEYVEYCQKINRKLYYLAEEYIEK